MLITRNNSSTINIITHDLATKFNIKKLGLASNFLSIQINKIKTYYFLHQQHYATELLHKAGLADAKHVNNLLAKFLIHQINVLTFTMGISITY